MQSPILKPIAAIKRWIAMRLIAGSIMLGMVGWVVVLLICLCLMPFWIKRPASRTKSFWCPGRHFRAKKHVIEREAPGWVCDEASLHVLLVRDRTTTDYAYLPGSLVGPKS